MSAPEWELSKENVAPVARGRNVDTLNTALTTAPAELEERRAFHEAAIRDAANGRGICAEDPLAPWVTYAKWAGDFYPRGSDLIITIVEGACRTFSKDERYREDRRFVRLWIRYADLRKDKLDVFAYMRRRRIGEHAALFYEAWATTFEVARMYDKAEETYELGMRLKAEPTARLAQRQREFINRMAARARRADKKKKDAEEKKREAEKVRESAAVNRGRRTLADDILTRPDREEASRGEPPTSDENRPPSSSSRHAQMVRPALGSISERQAESGRRPVAPADRKPVMKPKLSSRGPSAVGSIRANENQNVQQAKIEIFSDSQNAATSPLTTHRQAIEAEENFPLPLVAKRDEVHKENDGRVPEKWAGHSLPQDKKALAKLKRSTPSAQPHFEIYQDAEEKNLPDNRPDLIDHGLVEDNPTEHRPLAESPTPARKTSSRVAALSPTINTKIAMENVDGMFNSPLPMERVREEFLLANSPRTQMATEYNSRKAPVIEIFKDTDDDGDKENGLGTVNGSGGPEGPSGNPQLEKRVLQAIPDLEGPLIRRVDDDAVEPENDANLPDSKPAEHSPSLKESPALQDMVEYLAKWCMAEPSYQLIDGSDPEVEKDGMFDLHPKEMPVVSFNVDSYLWNGSRGNSRVVAVEDMNNVFNLRDTVEMADIDEEDEILALKVSDLSEIPNAWEFYIYKTLHDRYGSPLKSVATAIAFYEGNPRSFLVLDTVCWCSMLETISLSKDSHLSEPLAMFFTADLLRTLEAVHTVGIIHGDVTLDNVLLRNDPLVMLEEERYVASGAGTWASKGILLVDFNHAIDSKQAVPGELDMEMLANHAARLGNDFMPPDYRIPNAGRWGFNADCHAAAVCAYKMLGLQSMSVEGQDKPLGHERLWDSFFVSMQNLTAASRPSETVDTMRRCREAMEGALVGEKALKISLERLAAQMATKDIDDDTMA